MSDDIKTSLYQSILSARDSLIEAIQIANTLGMKGLVANLTRDVQAHDQRLAALHITLHGGDF